MVLALAPVAAGADACMEKGGATSHEVVAVLSPWIDDKDPSKGATPNGCPGDGKTWAVQYKTSKGGKWVTASDGTVLTKHSCVGGEKANVAPGQVWHP